MDVERIQAKLRAFAINRDWDQFHTPKNLAMALGSESGELLDLFQWLTPEEFTTLEAEALEQVRAELGDVLIYALRLADILGIDLDAAVEAKIVTMSAGIPSTSRKAAQRSSTPGGPDGPGSAPTCRGPSRTSALRRHDRYAGPSRAAREVPDSLRHGRASRDIRRAIGPDLGRHARGRRGEPEEMGQAGARRPRPDGAGRRVSFVSGRATDKTHNHALAVDLWGLDDHGATWEHIYFLDELVPRFIPRHSILNAAAGYKPDARVQGFNVLDEEKSRQVANALGLQARWVDARTLIESLVGRDLPTIARSRPNLVLQRRR